jgi:hypothetical protein
MARTKTPKFVALKVAKTKQSSTARTIRRLRSLGVKVEVNRRFGISVRSILPPVVSPYAMVNEPVNEIIPAKTGLILRIEASSPVQSPSVIPDKHPKMIPGTNPSIFEKNTVHIPPVIKDPITVKSGKRR